MRLRGKRWISTINGRPVRVENAWSFSFWAQERVVLDGLPVARTGEIGALDRTFRLSAPETGLPAALHVTLYAGLFKVHCQVWLGGARLTPDAVETGIWRAPRGRWPGEDGDAAALPA